MVEQGMPVKAELAEGAWGTYGATGLCPSVGATLAVLEELYQKMQVTPYRLAKLIGLSKPGSIYRWQSGARTPAAAFLIRMIWLLLRHSEGWPIRLVDKILWEESLVLWRDGSVTREDHRPGGPGLVAESFAADVWQMAETLSLARKRRVRENVRTSRYLPNGAIPPP